MDEIKEGRISIRDARYLFGRHVVDYVRNVEPVDVYYFGQRFWLCWFDDGHYELINWFEIDYTRDDKSPRPYISMLGKFVNEYPSSTN